VTSRVDPDESDAVTAALTEPPAATEPEDGLTVSEKSKAGGGGGTVTVRVKVAVRENDPFAARIVTECVPIGVLAEVATTRATEHVRLQWDGVNEQSPNGRSAQA
jgi:hypothetical protein